MNYSNFLLTVGVSTARWFGVFKIGRFLIKWIINALSLWILTFIFKGKIYFTGPEILGFIPQSLIVTTIVIGLVNAFIKPIIKFFTFGFYILTLGLFTFIVNGFLFWLISKQVEGFHVQGFITGIIGAFVMSLISFGLSLMFQK